MFSFLINSPICKAQGFQCVNPPVTPQQYAAFVSQVAAMNNSASNNSFLTSNIPVRFTIVKDSDGNGLNITQADIDAALSNLNNKFSDGTDFEFFQCGETVYLNASNLQDEIGTINLHSFVSSSVNVHIGAKDGSSAELPCATPGACPYDNVIFLQNSSSLLGPSFVHEMGHHFGLLHTFEQGTEDGPDYNYPVIDLPPYQPDHPYEGDEGTLRELVIRVFDDAKDFKEPNCGIAGDLMCDTPAECLRGSDFAAVFPESTNGEPCVGASCANGCGDVDMFTCEYSGGSYLDYNLDPLDAANIGKNFMSYWGDCRDEFTPDQFMRINFIYSTQRQAQYGENICGNWEDEVSFWGTNSGIENVTVQMTHIGESRFCNVTTDEDGDFYGILYDEIVTPEVRKLGSGNDNNDMTNDAYNYTYGDWTSEVTMFDLFLISQHILATMILDNGYAMIAADANNDGKISTLDLVKLNRLKLGIDQSLNDFQQPWRFVPEYIPASNSAFNTNPFNLEINGISYNEETPYLNPFWQCNILQEGFENRGFDAIKIGDVDGSSEPSAPEEPGDPVFITIKETIDNGKAKYDFQVEGFEDIVGYEMQIEFDKVSLDYLNSIERDLSGVEEDYFSAIDNEGIIKTLWYDSSTEQGKTLPSLDEIFRIVFNGSGNFSSANVQLSTESLSGSRVRAGYQATMKNYAVDKNGVFRPIIQKEIFENAIISMDVAPNPFKDNLNLNVEMIRGDYADLSIYNSIGQHIYTSKIYLNEGKNSLDLTSLTELPKGLFVVSVSSNGKTFTKKVIRH